MKKAYFHLPGLFEMNELYKKFIPLFYTHREFFYDYVEIGSIYGCPRECIWAGGRIGGDDDVKEIIDLLNQYNISIRFTFSNSLLEEKHLKDEFCNNLVSLLNEKDGVIIHSDLLLNYLKENYPKPYFISSTTKVLTNFNDLRNELNNENYRYVVPDFRLNKSIDKFNSLTSKQKEKLELLVNECCDENCLARKACYRSVSLKALNNIDDGFQCASTNSNEGYVFSNAMKNKYFISNKDIQNIYLINNITNFKIEGRSLGSAVVLEMLLYYLVKPEYQLKIRELIYLDSNLDLF